MLYSFCKGYTIASHKTVKGMKVKILSSFLFFIFLCLAILSCHSGIGVEPVD